VSLGSGGESNGGGTGNSGGISGTGGAGNGSTGGAGNGSTGGAGTGGVGTGGTGGGGPACGALVSAGPPIGVIALGPPFATEAEPVLRRAPNDEVTVAFSFDGMAAANPAIRHATFDPWTIWPPPEPFPDTVLSVGSYSFAVETLSTNFYGILHGDSPTPPGMAFSIATPGLPGAGLLTPTSQLAERALFAVDSHLGQHLVGMQRPGDYLASPSFQLEIGFVHQPPNGLTYVGPIDYACGDSPIAADAVAVSDGWLLARNATASSCADDVPPAPSTDVVVRRLGIGGMQFFAAELPGNSVVEVVDLEPRPAGAWLTYKRAATSAVEVALLDELGLLVDGPQTVSSASSFPLGAATTTLGEHLVIAFVDDPAGNPPDITLIVVNDALSAIASTSFEPAALASPSRVSVLGSEDADSVLVTWIAVQDGGTRVRMQRFDCVELAPP